jgi:hypothetical protein
MRKDSAGQVNQIYEEQTCTENLHGRSQRHATSVRAKIKIQARAGLLCELVFGSCPSSKRNRKLANVGARIKTKDLALATLKNNFQFISKSTTYSRLNLYLWQYRDAYKCNAI